MAQLYQHHKRNLSDFVQKNLPVRPPCEAIQQTSHNPVAIHDHRNKINLKKTRQIASHDYISVDFKPVFEICLQLISETIQSELINFFEGDGNEN